MTERNLNIAPYYDDFNEDKQFYKILFNPGRPVQARELTQLQSNILNQNKRMLEHFFEEGSMILPGQIGYDSLYSYVKIQPQYLTVDVNGSQFVGKVLTGQTSGVSALVLQYTNIENSDPKTFYVKYISSGSSGVNKVFANDEVLQSNHSTPLFCKSATTSATGNASAATIQEGHYFVNGYVAKVLRQTIVLDKYSNSPSYKVGLTIQESIVESGDDNSLLDNAIGSPNISAPGADRYKIELILSKKALNATSEENFIELMRLDAGEIKRKVVSPDYAYLEDTLAQRTFEESGNYTVKDFGLDIREHLKENNNGGKYTSGQGGVETKIAIGIEPGVAYVNGYRIESVATNYIDLDKSRTTAQENNGSLYADIGQYVIVNNIHSFPNFVNYAPIDLRNAVTVTRGTAAGTKIGTARVRGVELNSGVAGSGTETYKIYLFDIKMNSTKLFSEVRQLYLAGANSFTSDIVLNDASLAEIVEPSKNVSIFRFPISPVQRVRALDLSVDTLYDVKRTFTGTTTSRSITFNAGANEIFGNFNTSDWVLTITSGANVDNLVNLSGRITFGGSPVGKEVTINLVSAMPADASVRLVANITKQIAGEKSKTLQSDTRQVTTPTSTMLLNRADVYRIVGIYDSGNSGVNAVNTDLNITSRYSLDTGQRDNFYDIGSVTLKTGESAPVGRVLIEFEYFSHGAGDYFSVDSYTGQIAYKDIPSYIASNGSVYQLRDCLDYRPRIDNTGANFTGTGSSLTEQVRPRSNIFADYSYYLNRIDKLIVDNAGNFSIIKGVPGISPKPPLDIANGMTIYQLSIRAYTFTPKDIIAELIDNRRYTMRDIGKLEKRIDNLEYYTSLSLLESQTSTLQIIDPVTGLERFKNGFVVDSFRDHGVGDVTNVDYRCSIDRSNGELRPPFNEKNFKLEFSAADSSNYTKTGDLITLPFTESVFIKQPHASRAENVNPYAIFTFRGTIRLTPESDDWKDTETQPTLNVNLPDNVDVIAQIAQRAGFTGTQWNSWQDQWAGANQVTNQSVSTTRVTGNNVNEFGQSWPIRFDTTTRTTFAQEVGQQRSGVTTSIVPRTVQTSLGNRVVSVDLVPFMRSIEIGFSAKRLKPLTRIYAFFDGEPVSAYCKPTGGNYGDAMITDANGAFSGVYKIPNNNTIRFRTGERTFRLTDSSSNIDDNTTEAEVNFVARGLIQTQQETILSTRIAQVDRNQVSDSRTITRISQTTAVQEGQYFDPLAQTFLNEENGGCFITKIDLFFKSKDANIPVTVQLRAVVNGYPGPFIFPFGEVTYNPSQVNISANGSVATTFTFPSPVFLIPNVEYCFVVLSDSIGYELWTARIGDKELVTQNLISEQPYMGVLFKSQNSSTWTADQLSDIKFNLYKAQFNTGVSSLITFKNQVLDTVTLVNNPFYTTSASNQVVVFHRNHGFTNNSKVTISNVASGTYNGIAHTAFIGTFTVASVDLDRYTITVGSNANATGNTGGANIIATSNISMDIAHPQVQESIITGSQTAWALKTTSSKHPHGSQTPYVKDSSFQLCQINDNNIFNNPRLVASQGNETNLLAGAKSFELQGVLATGNANVSPVVDTQRVSVIAINNLIDAPESGNVFQFVAETSGQNGSAKAKYITKRITLNTPAIGVKIFAAVSRYNDSFVDLYFRKRTSDDTTKFEDIPWVKYDPVSNVPSNSESRYLEYNYLIDNQESFNTFQVKLVFRGTDSTKIVKLTDLRIIALGT